MGSSEFVASHQKCGWPGTPPGQSVREEAVLWRTQTLTWGTAGRGGGGNWLVVPELCAVGVRRVTKNQMCTLTKETRVPPRVGFKKQAEAGKAILMVLGT